MTIRKPMKAPAVPAAENTQNTEAPAAASATIADRFKLDAPEPVKKSAGGGKLALVTVIAAVVALGVAGVLTFLLYQHWEFLKGA